MFHFYNTFLNLFNISSYFSRGVIISSTGSGFSILTLFDLVTVAAILFPKYSPVLKTIFLETSNPLSHNCFLFFLRMTKIHIL